MIVKKATVSPYLDIRRKLNNERHPVTIRVTYARKQKYYTTSYSLSVPEYAKLWTPKARKEYRDILTDVKALEQKALEVISQLGESFTFKAFEAKYLKVKSKWADAFAAMEDYVKLLRSEGRVGSASSYECSLNSLKSYTERDKLSFTAIDVSFLKKYESWMLSNGKSKTTVGIYTRSLRTVYNLAIKNHLVSRDAYPFGDALYEIPLGRNIKKALTLQDIKLIFDYIPKSKAEAYARDLWVFSYMGNGMNIKDIALLKYKNINGDFILFYRAKTARTKKNPPEIQVPILGRMPEIIDRWGNRRHPDNYIFPILEHRITPQREMELIKNATHTINKYMKLIGDSVGIQIKITSYVARHSYSTVLKRSGASVEFISEQLGHSNTQVTQNYLDSFESDVKKETQKSLIPE